MSILGNDIDDLIVGSLASKMGIAKGSYVWRMVDRSLGNLVRFL